MNKSRGLGETLHDAIQLNRKIGKEVNESKKEFLCRNERRRKIPRKVSSGVCVRDRSDRSSSLKIRSCRVAFFLPQQSMGGRMDGSGRLTSRENLSKPTRHSIKQSKDFSTHGYQLGGVDRCPIRMLVSTFFLSLTKHVRFGKSECWAKLSLILLASCRCASVTSHFIHFSAVFKKISISQYFPYHFAPLGK